MDLLDLSNTCGGELALWLIRKSTQIVYHGI